MPIVRGARSHAQGSRSRQCGRVFVAARRRRLAIHSSRGGVVVQRGTAGALGTCSHATPGLDTSGKRPGTCISCGTGARRAYGGYNSNRAGGWHRAPFCRAVALLSRRVVDGPRHGARVWGAGQATTLGEEGARRRLKPPQGAAAATKTMQAQWNAVAGLCTVPGAGGALYAHAAPTSGAQGRPRHCLPRRFHCRHHAWHRVAAPAAARWVPPRTAAAGAPPPESCRAQNSAAGTRPCNCGGGCLVLCFALLCFALLYVWFGLVVLTIFQLSFQARDRHPKKQSQCTHAAQPNATAPAPHLRLLRVGVERHQLRPPGRHPVQLAVAREDARAKGLDAAPLPHHAKLDRVPWGVAGGGSVGLGGRETGGAERAGTQGQGPRIILAIVGIDWISRPRK